MINTKNKTGGGIQMYKIKLIDLSRSEGLATSSCKHEVGEVIEIGFTDYKIIEIDEKKGIQYVVRVDLTNKL
jgi:hypothetical protein